MASWNVMPRTLLVASAFVLLFCGPAGGEETGAVKVSVHGASHRPLRDALARAGIELVVFGRELKPIVVPEKLRYREVAVTELLDATAKEAGGSQVLIHRGSVAVLHRTISEEELAGIRRLLGSKEAAERLQGAWLAGWTADVRLVPAVVDAADDKDAGVRELALQAVRRWDWHAVALVEPDAKRLLDRELQSLCPELRWRALCSAALLGSAKAGSALRTALESCHARTRTNSRWAFWGFTRPEDMDYLARTYRSADRELRHDILSGLLNARCSEALPVIELAVDDKDPEVRKLAVMALGNMSGERTEHTLTSRFGAEDPMERGAAVAGWARAKGAVSLPLLEKALSDGADEVRYQAAWHLRCVGGAKAGELARKALEDRSPRVRGAALEALAELGGPSVVEAISRAEVDSEEMRLCLASSLVVSPQDAMQQFLADSLSSADFSTSYKAADALSRIGPDRLTPLVRKYLTAPERPRWTQDERLLRAMPREARWKLLAELMNDPEPRTRSRACGAAGELGGEPALELLGKALADADSDVRARACRMLGKVGGPGALRLLNGLLATEKDRFVRSDIMAGLGAVGLPDAWKAVNEHLADDDDTVRAGATWSLAVYAQTDIRQAMEKALSDKDPEGRCAAVSAFVDRWPSEAVEKVAVLLDDPDANVRRTTARMLAELIDARVPELLGKRLAEEKDKGVRRNILRSLRSFRESTVAKELLPKLSAEDRELLLGK